jgi:hypothetical protein
MTSSDLKFNSDLTAYFRALSRTDFDRSNNATLGIYLDMFSRTGIGFGTAVSYTSYLLEGYDERISLKSSVDFQYLSIKFQLQYKFLRKLNGPYIFVGGTLGQALRARVSYEDFNVRKVEAGYYVGLGYKFKFITLETRWEQTNGMSNFVHLSSTVDRYYLLLKVPFSLKKKLNHSIN